MRARFVSRNPLRTSQRKMAAPRWSVGNFFLESDVGLAGDDPASSVNVVVPIAQIPLLTPDTSPSDLFAQRAIRAIDVGGLVWTGIMRPNYHTDITTDFTGNVELYGQQLLVTDRLSPDGSPTAAVEAPWNLTTPPVTKVVLPTTGDDDYPIRILDRWAELYRMELDPRSFGDTSQRLWRVDDQIVPRHNRPRSKRLRVRVDGQHTLAFTFNTVKGPAFPTDAVFRSIRHVVIGTIYYRYIY